MNLERQCEELGIQTHTSDTVTLDAGRLKLSATTVVATLRGVPFVKSVTSHGAVITIKYSGCTLNRIRQNIVNTFWVHRKTS